MTELLILAFLLGVWTAAIRIIRKIKPGAVPALAHLALRTPLRKRFFGPSTVLQLAGIEPGWRVLDIGPGWGFMVKEASRHAGKDGELVGVDIDERMVRHSREVMQDEEGRAVFACADGACLPFKDDTFDSAVLVSVLGEVQDRRALFVEVRRCLKPGACAIVNELVFDPDYVFPWTISRLSTAAGLEVAETAGNIFCHTTRLRKPQAAAQELAAVESEACAVACL